MSTEKCRREVSERKGKGSRKEREDRGNRERERKGVVEDTEEVGRRTRTGRENGRGN